MKNKNPKVSVLMPAYNAEKYIAEAIESILNQTYKDFEFIIVDDCSTDDTAKIIKKYAKKDKRIKYFKNDENSGVTVSLNNGLKHCSGEFIARMDADDISLKDRFHEQLRFLKDFDVIGTNIVFVNEDGKQIGKRNYDEDVSKVITIESPLAHPTVMFKKSLVKERGYLEDLIAGQDYDLWLYLYSKGAKFKVIQKPLLKYRLHKETIKSKKTKQTIRDTLKTKKRARKEYGVRFDCKARRRICIERIVLLLPSKVILKLFNLVKRR